MFQRFIALISSNIHAEEYKNSTEQTHEDEIISIGKFKSTSKGIKYFEPYTTSDDHLADEIYPINGQLNKVIIIKRKRNIIEETKIDAKISLSDNNFKKTTQLTRLHNVSSFPYYKFAMSHCQQYIAILYKSNIFNQYNIKIFTMVANQFKFIRKDSVFCILAPEIIFAPNGSLFVINGDGFINKMDLNAKNFCKIKKFGKDKNYRIHIGCIESCYFNADGALIIIGQCDTIYVYYFSSIDKFIKQKAHIPIPLRKEIESYIGSGLLTFSSKPDNPIEKDTDLELIDGHIKKSHR